MLAGLAGHGEYVCGCPVNLRKDGIQRVLGNCGVVMQGGKAAFLSFQFLQQFGLQIGAAGYFKNFEQSDQCGMVIHVMLKFGVVRHTCEQVLQAQQSAHFFIERKFVVNHGSMGR